jgi:hypothetical protein
VKQPKIKGYGENYEVTVDGEYEDAKQYWQIEEDGSIRLFIEQKGKSHEGVELWLQPEFLDFIVKQSKCQRE